MVIHDGSECTFAPLPPAELKLKMASRMPKGIFIERCDLIDGHYEEIMAAKPDVSKNSAGYYLWNVYDRKTGVFDLTKLIVGS